jgi:hypothetical protein
MLYSSSFLRTALGVAVAALMTQPLAGCSGASQALPSGNVTEASATSRVSLANAAGIRPDAAVMYSYTVSGPGECATLWTFVRPSGPWISQIEPIGCEIGSYAVAGIAYASENKASFVGERSTSTNVIAVYNEKWKQVSELTGLTGDPVGIATDAKGTVFASNFPSNTLTEYARGGTSPIATYTDANLSSVSYVTVDNNGNVYVSGQSEGSGSLEVDELSTGSSRFSPIKTITGAIGAGIAVAHTGKTLWVCDEGNGSKGTISAYTIPAFKRSEQFAYSGDDTGIAVAPSGTQVSAVDNVAYGSGYNVSVVIYSAKTGKIINATPSVTMSAKSLGIAIRR